MKDKTAALRCIVFTANANHP